MIPTLTSDPQEGKRKAMVGRYGCEGSLQELAIVLHLLQHMNARPIEHASFTVDLYQIGEMVSRLSIPAR